MWVQVYQFVLAVWFLGFGFGIVHGSYEKVGQIGSTSDGSDELFEVHAFMNGCKIFWLNVFHAELCADQDEDFVDKLVFDYLLYFFFEAIDKFLGSLAWWAELFAASIELKRLFHGLRFSINFLKTIIQKLTLFERNLIFKILNLRDSIQTFCADDILVDQILILGRSNSLLENFLWDDFAICKYTYFEALQYLIFCQFFISI